MTSLPMLAPEPMGIIIRAGRERVRPVRFWAYLWSQEDDVDAGPWHERVPVEHAPNREWWIPGRP